MRFGAFTFEVSFSQNSSALFSFIGLLIFSRSFLFRGRQIDRNLICLNIGMSYKEIINQIKSELDKTIAFLEREVGNIRTSRASPSLIEDFEVECFDQKFALKQLGAISSVDSRTLTIQPWDKSYLEPIEKAISNSHLGVSPIVDKDLIRISFPQLSEEYRKDLLRLLAMKQEEAKRTIRRWREEAWRKIQDEFKEGNIREDDKFRGKDELQELIDEYNEKIEEMGERKKKELEN